MSRPTPHVLFVCGSLRRESLNAALIGLAVDRLPADATAEIYGRMAELPHYSTDLDGPDGAPEVAVDLRARIAAADGLVFVTPTYNHALPGGLKNLVDWASRPFGAHCLVGKRSVVLGCSGGRSGSKEAVAYLREMLPFLGGSVIGDDLPMPEVLGEMNPATGELSERIDAHLRGVLAALCA
jgi:chromate reductase